MRQSFHQFLRDSRYVLTEERMALNKQSFAKVNKAFIYQRVKEASESCMAIIYDYVNLLWPERGTIQSRCLFWDCLFLLLLRENMPVSEQLSGGQYTKYMAFVYERIQSCIGKERLKMEVCRKLQGRKERLYYKLKLPQLTRLINASNSSKVLTIHMLMKYIDDKRQISEDTSYYDGSEEDNKVQQPVKGQREAIISSKVHSVEIVRKKPIISSQQKERQALVRKVTYDLAMVLQSLLILPNGQTIQGNYYTIVNPKTAQSDTFPLWKVIYDCRRAVLQGKVSAKLELMQKYAVYLKSIYRQEYKQMMQKEKDYWEKQESQCEVLDMNPVKDYKTRDEDPFKKQNNFARSKKYLSKKQEKNVQNTQSSKTARKQMRQRSAVSLFGYAGQQSASEE